MATSQPTVPYVPFKTFLTALDTLEQGLPGQIDRSLWPSYSGAIQGQLLGAFRFLDLMDENHCPSDSLRRMVGDRERRRALLRQALEHHYLPLMALDLGRVSPHQFDESMKQYGLSGATCKKAASFFLQAAQYVGIPLSVQLKARTRTAAFGRRRSGSEPKGRSLPAASPTAISKTVALRSGGSVTISALLDVFSLDAGDRAFVFDLIDRLRLYQDRRPDDDSE